MGKYYKMLVVMKNKYAIFTVTFTALFLIASTPSSYCQHFSNIIGKNIIYVDDSNILGPWDGTNEHPFRYIQDGIDVSSDDDIIYIYNGTYNESLHIKTAITLYGEKTPLINGSYRPVLIMLTSENVTLQNLLIQNAGGYPNDAGVVLNSSHAIIVNCIFYRTKTGISARNTSFHTIKNCTFFNNGIGVSLLSTKHVTIKDCTFGKNSIGVHCENASHVTLASSYFHTNGRACFFHHSHSISLIECDISDNSVNHGGVFLDSCFTMTFTNNILRHNGIALRITQSENIKIHCCTLSFNTHFAIVVDTGSSQINITHCDIIYGFRSGVYLAENCSVALSHNNIYSNTLYGLYAAHSDYSIQSNYWGSRLGPSLTGFGVGEQVHMPFGRLKSYPWKTQILFDVGANWTYHKPYLNRTIQNPKIKTIHFSTNDTDDDGAPDWWEKKWGYDSFVWENHSHLDPDNDALNNIEECFTDAYGSNPFHKDIFLEIDWMNSNDPHKINKPGAQLIKEAEDTFEQHNITLHVDVGYCDGGEEIPSISNVTFLDVLNIYWQYFLHADLDNPRKGIFRYGIICDDGPDVNFPFMGWDELDSFLISSQELSEQFPWINRSQLIMKAAIHHLGHTLGLLADLHGGIDNVDTLRPLSLQWFMYRNYKSCMNYWYKYRTFSYSDGTHGPGDFNDYRYLNFSFFKNTLFPLI